MKNKYMFELQGYKKIYIEAENIEDAREIACFNDENQFIQVDYVSDGQKLVQG